MKFFLLILISTIGLANSAKADTIDYWHVYYNDIKIEEYNLHLEGEIVFKLKDIENTDTLTIVYFCDTPCDDCLIQVSIESGNNFVITKTQGVQIFNSVKISMFDSAFKADREFHDVYYHEERENRQTEKVLLFRIKIE